VIDRDGSRRDRCIADDGAVAHSDIGRAQMESKLVQAGVVAKEAIEFDVASAQTVSRVARPGP
jgi:hypothetical protein